MTLTDHIAKAIDAYNEHHPDLTKGQIVQAFMAIIAALERAEIDDNVVQIRDYSRTAK